MIPFILAWNLRHFGPFALPANAKLDLQVFFSSLYSESYFNEHRADFFSSAGSFWQLNFCLFLRMYTIILIASLCSNLLIIRYGRMRKWLDERSAWYWRFARWLLATFVLPRIAEWHLILSPVLLAAKKMAIEVDVLAKNGILYAGRLANKMLTADGDLQSITLGKPRRFKREEYLEARKTNPELKADGFWKPIPGELFVIMASEISTVNIRHIPAVPQFAERFNDVAKLFGELKRLLEQQGDRTQGRSNFGHDKQT